MPPVTEETVNTLYAGGQNPTQAITVTAGNIICGQIDWGSGTAMTSISSALGNTINIVDQTNSGLGGKSTATFWGLMSNGGSETITFNHGASTTSHITVHEVSGTDGTGPDKHVIDAISTNNTTTNGLVGSDVTPTTDGQYVASFFHGEINGVAISIGTDLSWIGGVNQTNVKTEYLVQSTAAAIHSTWTKTGGGTNTVGVGLMTFKAATAGPGAGSDSSPVQMSEASTNLVMVTIIEETS